jgi:hypothetical protein
MKYMKGMLKAKPKMDEEHEECAMEAPKPKGSKGNSALKKALLAKTLARFRK